MGGRAGIFSPGAAVVGIIGIILGQFTVALWVGLWVRPRELPVTLTLPLIYSELTVNITDGVFIQIAVKTHDALQHSA